MITKQLWEAHVFYSTTPAEGEAPNGGLPWDPFKALVGPRPIGWITSLSPSGSVNLAPFSYFGILNARPNLVYVGCGELLDGGRKDTQRNAEETGEFVCNVVSWDLHEEMSVTSDTLDRHVSEADLVGLDLVPGQLCKTPRVAAAPAALECRYLETYVPQRARNTPGHTCMVVGEVVSVYIDDQYIADGRVDTAAMKPVVRMGYDEYAVITDKFHMDRRPPDYDPAARQRAQAVR